MVYHGTIMPLQTCPSCIIAAAILVVLFVSFTGCLQDGAAPASPPGPINPAPAPGQETVSPITTHYSPWEITRLGTAAYDTANTSLTMIAALPPEKRTFENTVLAFDTAMGDYTDAVYPMTLMGYVYPDAQVASEGMALEEASAVFSNDVYTRRGLYQALKGQTPRTPEELRLYTLTIRNFEKNGLKLPDDRLAKVRQMNDELSALEVRFSTNLNNDNTTLEFSEPDLAGVPASSVAAFEKTLQGTYRVTMKYPDYAAVMTYADRGATRKAMYLAYYTRQAAANTALLEEAIALRQEIAHELGYPTWADYKTDGRMAKNASNVMAFLDSVKQPLQEKSRKEYAELLALKQGSDPSATMLEPWDIAYLQEKLKAQRYAYDENEVKEYFPVDGTIGGVFSIYGELFGIRFEEVQDAPVWSPGVRLYRITNQSDSVTIGYLYLDLYPREGKYSHFATFPVRNGRMKDGRYLVPVTAIIGNFPAPADGKPGLLTMYDVETIFHEGGHAMHTLLTTVPYGTQSGFNTEWDFVETPSQTLEEWTWDPEVLTPLSGCPANASEKIPANLRDKIIAVRDVGAGYDYSTMLAKSYEDMEFHMAEGPVDTRAVYARIYKDMTGLSLPDEIHQPASFGHLMGGYDAGYYGYLWSKVYAMEITGEFKRDGMTNRTTGLRFRQEVLSQGNMQDGTVLLQNFLGREPGPGAFYERLGIRQG
jgi:thimet oligopeptidase